MKNSKLLRGLIIFGLSIVGNSPALAQVTASPSTPSASQAYVNAWRTSAKKNFFEGFCVGQTLAAQQIIVQPSQQVDQVTANAFKAAITSCKARSKSVGGSSPSTSL